MAARIQYAESAFSYSLMHLKKDVPDKAPTAMKQIITEHMSKIQKIRLPSSPDTTGESLVHTLLLKESKKFL